MQNKPDSKADTILVDARIATLDERESFQSALAMKNGRFVAVGDERDIMGYRNAETRVIDVSGRTVIPGLVDSHTHFIREGLNYNLELRWNGVRSFSEGLTTLREQVKPVAKFGDFSHQS
jgi:hypothetical protein